MADFFLTDRGWPRSWLRWVLLGLVCGVGLFSDLGVSEIGLMEARNFVAAREIHAGGSWLLPTMNGELRLAKPPLPTWLVAVVMHVTGNTTELALLRVPSAMGACLMVLFFWGLARRLAAQRAETAETAWLAALVLASSLLFLTTGRDGNGWDVYTYSFAVGALLAAVRGIQSTDSGWGWFTAAGLLLGLSALSKGPVGLYGMVLPFTIAYAWRGDRAAAKRHTAGLVLMVVVGVVAAGAWPLYVLLQHQQEATAVARVESSSWFNRHVQSIWFYAHFPVFMGVWVVVALAALVWPYAAPRIRPYAPYGMVFAWAGFTLLLLNLVPEKKERYLLPVLPPLALLVAGLLRYLLSPVASSPRPDGLLQRVWAGLLILAFLGAPVGLWLIKLPSFVLSGVRFWLVGGGFLVLAVRLLRAWRTQRLLPETILSSLGLVLLATGLLMPAYADWRRRRDDPGLRTLTAVIRQHPALLTRPVYSLSPMHIKWVWAARRVVPAFPDTAGGAVQPFVVYSSNRAPQGFPFALRQRFVLATIDSFHVSNQHEEGMWYVVEVKAKGY